jgi:hypothetical protein
MCESLVPARRRRENGEIMKKKVRSADKKSAPNELRPEYAFDYRRAKPNRFAAKLKQGGRLIVLEPELAAVFKNSDDVNCALRALVGAMPRRRGK